MREAVGLLVALLFLAAELVVLVAALRAKGRGSAPARKVGGLAMPVAMVGIAATIVARPGASAILNVAGGMAAASGTIWLIDAARRRGNA